MKKKILIVCAFFAFTIFSASADIGLGAELGFESDVFYKPYSRGFVSATFRSNEIPWCFSVNFFPFDSQFVANADNWVVNKTLSAPLRYFLFWGVSARLGFNKFAIAAGPRLGAGLDLFLLKKRQLELYWQISWNPYLGVEDRNGVSAMIRPFHFPIELGARWWFR
ncbi:hypothetical protein HRO26_02355 [Treponema pectinovorum]|uniref:hypothetical protein n=1 Tax=Treponema pectinovorum TaxID=164 RepID=UPI003D9309EB